MVEHKQNELKVYPLVLSGELWIDKLGQVWRLKKRTGDRWTGGVKITPCAMVRAENGRSGNNYLQVRAMIDGVRYHAAAARLVWLHFKGPIPQGLTINHKDGWKPNNRPRNLELATYSRQRLHAIQELGAKHHDVRGSKHPKTALTEEMVVEIRQFRKSGLRLAEIAKRYEVTPNVVWQICSNRTWKHVPNPAFFSPALQVREWPTPR